MKVLKNIINTKLLIIGLVLGSITGCVGVWAATYSNSNDTYYDNSKTNLVSTNVQDALDELYDRYLNLRLYDTITSKTVMDNTKSTYVSLSSGISFSSISSDTNGKGIYEISSTKDDEYPIYYYRGAVEDNNVIFANFCWKIVRTTETGGVKLIYNGEPSNGQCNNTGTSSQLSSTSAFNSSYGYNAYVGYMYGTAGSSTYEKEHANTNDSTIKTVIDSWYKSNMTSYTYMLEDTVWCNDRSIDTVSGYGTGLGYGTNQTGYNARYRIYASKMPSLACANANDKFTVSSTNGNGILIYPVGLLTVDEASYAGALYNTANSTYYLYTGQNWWTLSPSTFNGTGASMWGVYSNGRLATGYVNSTYGVRPVISLKSGTTYSKGNGTVNSPYVIDYDNDFSINNGDSETETQSVTLSLSYDSKVTQMCISNTSDCSDYEDVSSTKDWTLSAGKGNKNVYVYYKNKYGDIIAKLNKSITFSPTLYYLMASKSVLDNKSSTYVSSSSGISFSSISSDTNGKGVYELSTTKDDKYPIYYYRGAVTDNNVLFAGFCWKIVRTTETGGVKLIYNGEPSSDGQCDNTGTSSQLSSTSAFNSSYGNNAYFGYMYGTPGSSTYAKEHANTNNSTIKTAIDNWYKSNMTGYTDKLEDTVWCNDRSIYSGNGYGTSTTTYGAYNRLYTNKTPSLACVNENDRFTVGSDNGNGALTYPVALLTADEIAYAGGVYKSSNSTYYLYSEHYWWAMTPFYFQDTASYVGDTRSDGALSSRGSAYTSAGVRPAVSLKPGIKYIGGDGSSSSPYIVK